MSKRSVNILVGAVILVVVAGTIGYFVSPNFQAWVQVWLARPDGLAATATTFAALATLLAVIVGLRGIQVGRELALKALEEGHNQFLEAQYNASRPLVVPVSPDPSEQYEAEESVIVFDWNTTMFTTIQNVGTGIATNIWIALLPPAPMSESSSQYARRLGSPIAPGGDPLKVYLHQDITLFKENDSINDYSLCVPPDRTAGSTERADRFIARMSITYQDIFGRKHASIFDFSERGIWVNVAILPNIAHDLGDMDAAKENKSINAKVTA